MLFGPTLLVCSAGMIRREQVEAVGGFDASLPLVEDVEVYLRAMRQGAECPAIQITVGKPGICPSCGGDQIETLQPSGTDQAIPIGGRPR
jgi:hypothetical protein